jgi:hypothetical protein
MRTATSISRPEDCTIHSSWKYPPTIREGQNLRGVEADATELQLEADNGMDESSIKPTRQCESRRSAGPSFGPLAIRKNAHRRCRSFGKYAARRVLNHDEAPTLFNHRGLGR